MAAVGLQKELIPCTVHSGNLSRNTHRHSHSTRIGYSTNCSRKPHPHPDSRKFAQSPPKLAAESRHSSKPEPPPPAISPSREVISGHLISCSNWANWEIPALPESTLQNPTHHRNCDQVTNVNLVLDSTKLWVPALKSISVCGYTQNGRWRCDEDSTNILSGK